MLPISILIFETLLQEAKTLFGFDSQIHICQIQMSASPASVHLLPNQSIIISGFCNYKIMAQWFILKLSESTLPEPVLLDHVQYFSSELDILERLYICMQAPACLRESPNHRAQMVSQIWYGMPLELLYRQADGWACVRAADDYVGWLEAEAVSKKSISSSFSFSSFDPNRFGRCEPLVGWVLENENPIKHLDSILVRLHSGSLVWVGDDKQEDNTKQSANHICIALADNGSGQANQNDLIFNWQIDKNTALRALKYARTHIGTSYLWGGNTPLGFDCSGLVQWAFWMAAGVLLPRDACEQVLLGEPLLLAEPESWQAGDLLFFGANDEKITHVALYQENNNQDNALLYLHASGYVRQNSLLPAHILYEPNRHQTLRQIRRLGLDVLQNYHFSVHKWFLG